MGRQAKSGNYGNCKGYGILASRKPCYLLRLKVFSVIIKKFPRSWSDGVVEKWNVKAKSDLSVK